MSGETVEYVHLPAGSALQLILPQPRRVMVLIEQDASLEWQGAVSQWIVASGCLYMMAWGRNCSSWDDSVDHAMLQNFGGNEIPDDRFIMTTWHEREPLSGVFFFARVCAIHPTIEMPVLTILDIRDKAREADLLALHRAESAGLLDDTLEDPRDLPLRQRLKILLRLK